MRIWYCGIVLLISFLATIFAQDWDSDEKRGFDSDWLFMGSDLRSLGRPKLKISQHPDGYSFQLGFSGYFMRVRFDDIDNSIQFTIMDYKGSIKYKLDKHNRLGEIFEAEAEVHGQRETGELPIDGKLKISNSYKQNPYGPSTLNIELTFTNKFPENERVRVWLPSDGAIQNAENIEAVLKISINPVRWAESKFNFYMSMKGDVLKEGESPWNDNNYQPGTYNMSATLQVIKVDEPNPRQRQPKMTAALDLTEDVTYEQDNDYESISGNASSADVPRNFNFFKKSIILEGMIDLTGKGRRLAVVKATDATTDKSLGRIQARSPDDENLRLEVFANGEQKGALNVQQTSTGITNVTVEDNEYCESDDPDYEDYPSYGGGVNVTSSYDSYNSSNLNGTRVSSSSENCNIYRLLESVVSDGVMDSRIYQDVLFIGAPPSYRRREGGEKSLIMEEKWLAKNGRYEQNVFLFNGVSGINLTSLINVEPENTLIQFGSSTFYRPYSSNNVITQTDEQLDVEITPSTTEDGEWNFKLSYNNNRIFDGWAYFTSFIRKMAREQIPAYMKRQLDSFKDSHDETFRYLKEYL